MAASLATPDFHLRQFGDIFLYTLQFRSMDARHRRRRRAVSERVARQWR
jgi:hypothetical protein